MSLPIVPDAVPGMEELFPEAIDALLAESEQLLDASCFRQNSLDVEACLLYQKVLQKKLLYLAEQADRYTERYGLPDNVLDSTYKLNAPKPTEKEAESDNGGTKATTTINPARTRWTAAEHALLKQAVTKFGLKSDNATVRKFAQVIRTRDIMQIRDKVNALIKRNRTRAVQKKPNVKESSSVLQSSELNPTSLQAPVSIPNSLEASGSNPTDLQDSESTPKTKQVSGLLPNTVHASESTPQTKQVSGLLPNTMHASGSIPNTVHASGPLSNTVHASGSIPNTVHASGPIPNTVHASGSIPNNMQTPGSTTNKFKTAD